jgi:hypothetical protein
MTSVQPSFQLLKSGFYEKKDIKDIEKYFCLLAIHGKVYIDYGGHHIADIYIYIY